jgi:hypothetical protein
MTHRIKIVIIGLLLITVSLTAYYTIKSERLKKGYVEKIESQAKELAPVISSINENSETSPEGKNRILENIIKADPSIAMIALLGKSGEIKSIAKNNSIITSSAVYDSIVSDLTSGKLTKNRSGSITYTTPGGRKKEFFIASGEAEKSRAVIANIYRPDTKTVVRLTLEVLLIIIFSIIATAAFFMLLFRKGIIKDNREVREKIINLSSSKEGADDNLNRSGEIPSPAEEPEPMPIDEGELSRVFSADEKPATRGAALTENKTAQKELNSRIFELFKKIHSTLSPEYISLYIKKTRESMSKTYELKGKAFLKIDSAVMDRIELKNLAEITKPGAYISEKGTVITVPLFDDNSLTGLIKIKLKESTGKVNLEFLQNELRDTAREIKEYLIINSVITDKNTGFYSNAYFNIKLHEEINRAVKSGLHFSLIITDIFRNTDITDEQKKIVLKIIHPGIKETSGEKYGIFLLQNMIAAIMPGAAAEEAEKTKESLVKNISRYRIKLSENEIISLRPRTVLINSAETEDVKNILNEALELIQG